MRFLCSVPEGGFRSGQDSVAASCAIARSATRDPTAVRILDIAVRNQAEQGEALNADEIGKEPHIREREPRDGRNDPILPLFRCPLIHRRICRFSGSPSTVGAVQGCAVRFLQSERGYRWRRRSGLLTRSPFRCPGSVGGARPVHRPEAAMRESGSVLPRVCRDTILSPGGCLAPWRPQ